MAGDDEGHDLIADLVRRQALAGVVACREEEVDHVAAGGSRTRTPTLQQVIHGGVEFAHGTMQGAVALRRKPLRRWNGRPGPGDDDVERCERCLGQAVGILGEVRPEERIADDFQGGIHHGLVHVDGHARRATSPGVDEPARGNAHVVDDVGQGLVVERRLNERPLAAPGRSVGSEESFTGDERERSVLDRRLAVTVRVGHKDAAGGRRVVDEVARRRGDRELNDIAVFAPGTAEVLQRTAPDRGELLEHRVSGRAGGRRGGPEIPSVGHRASGRAHAATVRGRGCLARGRSRTLQP